MFKIPTKNTYSNPSFLFSIMISSLVLRAINPSSTLSSVISNKFTTNYKYGLLITVGVYFFYIICIIVFDYAGKYNPHLGKYATYGAEENSIFTIVCAVSLFCCFKNLKIKNSKYINYFAQSMFGVYLVHDNNYVRYFLWREIFKSNEKIYSRYFVLYSIGIIFLVFCCSVFIDIFRREVLVKRVLLKRILNRRKGYE